MKKFVPLALSILLLAGCTAKTQTGGGAGSENTQQAESSKTAFEEAVSADMSTEQPPEFLSDENKELFEKAEYIYFNTNISTGFNFTASEENKTTDFEGSEERGAAFKTDYDYSEFKDYLKSTFTGDALNEIQLSADSAYLKTSDGKLCWIDAARGTNISYKDKQFELVSESDDKIEFKAIANYSWEAVYDTEEKFKQSGIEGDYNWSEEYKFELTKTDKGWRVSHFEGWK